MKIGVIGGGAVGLMFGAYLSHKHDVTIFSKRQEQARQLNKYGINLIHQDEEKAYKTFGIADYVDLDIQDFVIVAVKEYDLHTLVPVLNNIPNIPLLFIQNGMGHLRVLEDLPQENIFIGTVEHGVTRVNDHTIVHTGIGKTNIGIFRGETSNLSLFPMLEVEQFPFVYEENYEEMLQSKLIANAVINPLTAIFNVRNGNLLKNKHFHTVFLELFHEIMPLFPNLDSSSTLHNVESICNHTKDNTSSMLKDIKESRRTEIDAILGYILEIGELKGFEMKITSMIFNIIKGMENEGGFVE